MSTNSNDRSAAASDELPLVVITGSSGLIGSRLADGLAGDFRLVGLDLKPPRRTDSWIKCDMTSDASVHDALERVRREHGNRIASVVHLAAYYDFSGEPSPLYRTLTVEGTRRLLAALQKIAVEQFVFSSTLLVMRSAEDDVPLTADSPVEAEWDYPRSKLEAERVIREQRGDIPAVILRLAGVYDAWCHSLPIAQQIRRIYERQLESYMFPGDKTHGQAFVHLDDLVDCFRQVIQRRRELTGEQVFLVGEEDVMSYEELQEEIGLLVHGREWPTIRIPKAVAKAGAWAKEKLAGEGAEEPFIKPWMIDLADQNYPVDLEHARRTLAWQPRHSLRETLPAMIERLHADPKRWYQENKLPWPGDDQADRPAPEARRS